MPSAALLRALPELMRDRRPSELFIKRRWLYREAGTMIARPAPWNAEYQSRVLRNLPGAWRFDGRVHSDVRVLGDRRHIEAPIYHCALLLQSPEAREKRALTYELLRPGVSYGGLPTNGMYLPELVEGVEVEPVPEEDRELIERVLGGSSARSPRGADVEAHASREQVNAYNGTRRVGSAAYGARLELVAPPARVLAGTTRHLEVRATNLGDQAWPAGEADPLIRLGYRWRDPALGRVVTDGRGVFSETVAPGATTLVLLAVAVPDEVGSYELELDVVHEHVRWFDCVEPVPMRVDADAGALLVSSPRLPQDAFEGELVAEGARLGEALIAANAAAERANADLDELRAQRRWRVTNLLARPFDAVRRRRR